MVRDGRIYLSQRSPQFFRRVTEAALAPAIRDGKIRVRRAASIANSAFAKVSVEGLGGLDPLGIALQYLEGVKRYTGDTVTIVRDGALVLRPSFSLPPDESTRARYARELRTEPLLEVEHPAIVALAKRLRMRESMPDVVVQRLMTWVHDSLAKEPSVTLPSAVATLRSRRGDCNEHAQLFVALARAAGLPARTVSGVVAIDGKFYYHAWAEVMLQRWVGVDPTLGQFPTDATHLRLLTGGLAAQAELARVIGRLDLSVVGPQAGDGSANRANATTPSKSRQAPGASPR